mmetsp:Transcript_38150/g.79552  ORF Transcript_38150/g.79552 Transcript_38150/m.79552 type:complete len:243 (-) Transcript_38150:303-1031(-)
MNTKLSEPISECRALHGKVQLSLHVWSVRTPCELLHSHDGLRIEGRVINLPPQRALLWEGQGRPLVLSKPARIRQLALAHLDLVAQRFALDDEEDVALPFMCQISSVVHGECSKMLKLGVDARLLLDLADGCIVQVLPSIHHACGNLPHSRSPSRPRSLSDQEDLPLGVCHDGAHADGVACVGRQCVGSILRQPFRHHDMIRLGMVKFEAELFGGDGNQRRCVDTQVKPHAALLFLLPLLQR